MCLILDANKYDDFLNPKNEDMQPVRNWIEKKGKIAYSPTEKFERELTKRMKSQFHAYTEAGKIKLFNKECVESAQNNLSNLVSDDPHIIALASVAKVRLLVSSDTDLHEDFKNVIRGRIYQNRNHKRLLTNDLCP